MRSATPRQFAEQSRAGGSGVEPAGAGRPGAGRPPSRRAAAGRGRTRGGRGMVTAELATGLLVVGLVLFLAASLVGLLVEQDRLEASATQIARSRARGDQKALAQATKSVPANAQVTTRVESGWVRVQVRWRANFGPVATIDLTASGSAPLEPGQS